jgi:ankyrin repeat protein
MRTKDSLNPILIASLKGNSDVVAALLENNANVDSQTNDGTSALMIASANGHPQVVRLLLEKGANASLKNKYGKSAIDVAASEEIRKLLTDNTQKH